MPKSTPLSGPFAPTTRPTSKPREQLIATKPAPEVKPVKPLSPDAQYLVSLAQLKRDNRLLQSVLTDALKAGGNATKLFRQANAEKRHYRLQMKVLAGTVTDSFERIILMELCAKFNGELIETLTNQRARTLIRARARGRRPAVINTTASTPPTEEWSDNLTLAAVREGWKLIPVERREEIAMRLLDDLCKPPHERGTAWIALIRARDGLSVTPA